MGEIVNLRMARKRRQREEDAKHAAENRAHHGRSKAEKQRSRDETSRLGAHLDGHRLDPADRVKE